MSGEPFTFLIHASAPYDFDHTVKRLHGVKHEAYSGDGGTVARTLWVPSGHAVLALITSEGTVDAPLLRARVYGELDERDQCFVRQELERILSVRVNLPSFYSHVHEDEVLSRLCQSLYGLRIMLEGSLFECMVKTIAGQQMNLAFAASLVKRLMDRTTKPIIHEGKAYPVFPTAETVAKLSCDDLIELQFSRRKAEYIIDFARMVAEGRVDLQELSALSDEDIIRRLTTIRGIGRWTVECFLLFGMGRENLLPAADIGLRNAVRYRYGWDRQPSEKEIRELGIGWSPWSSYVTFYLWESLNQRISS